MAETASKSSYYKTGLDLAGFVLILASTFTYANTNRSFTPSSCVTIRVGPVGSIHERFVHKSLLCQNSPFFERALEKSWKEGQSNIINLPDDQVSVCDLYFAWLYGRNPFVLLKSDEYAESGRTIATTSLDEQLFLDSWILGDKLLDHDYCDMVIDTIINHATQAGWWPYKNIFTIYEMTPDTAPVHRFLVDIYLYVANAGWDIIGPPTFSAEAYRDITNALVAKRYSFHRSEVKPWVRDPCVYHWHKKEHGLCYKQKGKWNN